MWTATTPPRANPGRGAGVSGGGWVAFVEDGELVEHGRVALVTVG
ncbi:MAG: hypothetical protein WCG47_15575 [Dermatophilaceae bacterium]